MAEEGGSGSANGGGIDGGAPSEFDRLDAFDGGGAGGKASPDAMGPYPRTHGTIHQKRAAFRPSGLESKSPSDGQGEEEVDAQLQGGPGETAGGGLDLPRPSGPRRRPRRQIKREGGTAARIDPPRCRRLP